MSTNEGQCVSCSASFQGEPIPQDSLYMYSGQTHYSRLIGIEIGGIYDGVLIWQCPDCGFMWPRFIDGRRYEAAMNFIAGEGSGLAKFDAAKPQPTKAPL